MPKKTRQQKILADSRKSPFQFVASLAAAKNPIQPFSDPDELTAIKKDLTKTMLLATLAIGAELALYFFGKGNI